ncbi:hypothetical protein AXG93_1154s1650 [Marchantia polymorpha subsp. ruderalis]|uniref:histidine--tRNA ligase n=1 Tax=Marchantia polymorpha subsp. ruderalis TaxID=1480154 RepID=A0A176WRH0_MARPO|nr:hypothetical protein AXG93_1154s1650 [Marchantia polymorpha subsp. ruderalis]
MPVFPRVTTVASILTWILMQLDSPSPSPILHSLFHISEYFRSEICLYIEAEAELLSAIVAFFSKLGITSSDVGVKISNRKVLQEVLGRSVIPESSFAAVCVIVDKIEKIPRAEVEKELTALGLPVSFRAFDRTGTLRAICGGGRYDKLLSTFGGVDTPACGFGFGDAVIVKSTVGSSSCNALVSCPARTCTRVQISLSEGGLRIGEGDSFRLGFSLPAHAKEQ